MKKKALGVILAVLAVSGVWAVPTALAKISPQEVEQIVTREYPGASIHKVEQDYEHGRQVYEVDFQTQNIWDGDLTIDVETGAILERDIEYRDGDHHGHQRHR